MIDKQLILKVAEQEMDNSVKSSDETQHIKGAGFRGLQI